MKDKTTPSIYKVDEFAKMLNISSSWLAYGDNKETTSSVNEDSIIDLVSLIHNKVDEWLDNRDKEMDYDKKSILVKLIYKKMQLQELESLSSDEVNKSIDDIIEILDAA